MQEIIKYLSPKQLRTYVISFKAVSSQGFNISWSWLFRGQLNKIFSRPV